jgi:hypothetical protein
LIYFGHGRMPHTCHNPTLARKTSNSLVPLYCSGDLKALSQLFFMLLAVLPTLAITRPQAVSSN